MRMTADSQQSQLQRHASEIQRRTRNQRVGYGIVTLMGTLGFVAVWHAISQLEGVSRFMLPPPADVWNAFIRLSESPYLGDTLWGHTRDSIALALIGWAAAGLVGLPLGVMVGWSERISRLVMPLFNLIRPIPPIAWIPIVIIWLGVGTTARAFVVFLSAWVPFVLNSAEAVHTVDQILVRAGRTLGARNRKILTRIVLPTAMPMLVTGSRIALGNAWMTLIAAELLAASSGLGFIALNARRTFDTDVILMAMGVIGLFGAGISFALRGVERWISPWSAAAVRKSA